MKLSTFTMILAILFAFFFPVKATTTTISMSPAVPETMSTIAVIEKPAFGLNVTSASAMMECNTTTTTTVEVLSFPVAFRLAADKAINKSCLAAIVAIVMAIWGYVTAIESIALFLGLSPCTIAFAMPLVCCLSWDYYWCNEDDDNGDNKLSLENEEEGIDETPFLDTNVIDHTTVDDTTCPNQEFFYYGTNNDKEDDCAGWEDCMQLHEMMQSISVVDLTTNQYDETDHEETRYEDDDEENEEEEEEEEELECDDDDEEELEYDSEEDYYYEENTQEEDDEYYHEEDINDDDEYYYEEATVEEEPRPPFRVGDRVLVSGGANKGKTGRIFSIRGPKGKTWDICLDKASGGNIIYKPSHMLQRLD